MDDPKSTQKLSDAISEGSCLYDSGISELPSFPATENSWPTSAIAANKIAGSFFPLGIQRSVATSESTDGGRISKKATVKENTLASLQDVRTSQLHSNASWESQSEIRDQQKPVRSETSLSRPPVFDRHPVNPFAIPGLMAPFGGPHMVYPQFQYSPEMAKFLQSYGGTGVPGRSSSGGDFEHNYQFQSPVAKAADDKMTKHLMNLGKTLRAIVKMVGSFESAFITIRGCFYGLLHAVEYGTHGFQILNGIPVVRLIFAVFGRFLKFLKLVGRKGPIVGLLALLCSFVGRACIPLVQGFLRPSNDRMKPARVLKVAAAYSAKNSNELDVASGEEIVIVDGKCLLSDGQTMVFVRRNRCRSGERSSGLIPKYLIATANARTPVS